MQHLRDKLISQVKEISRVDIGWEDNLLSSGIDSMSLVTIVNIVDDLAREYQRTVNLNSLISDDSLSVKDIFTALENGKK